MLFAFAFGIDKDIIEVHYDKNIILFFKNLINIALKYDQCIDQSKRHYLLLKMAIAGLKGHLLFIAFFDSHLMISIGQIKMSKILSST